MAKAIAWERNRPILLGTDTRLAVSTWTRHPALISGSPFLSPRPPLLPPSVGSLPDPHCGWQTLGDTWASAFSLLGRG